MKKIITISRQFGSGGRAIGKAVAEKLGIPCYDKEIIERVAESSGLSRDYIEATGEYSTHRTWLGRALSTTHAAGTLNNEDLIWVEQRKLILDLAEKGACVIVGRCADYILKDMDNVVNVFIWADIDFRIERAIRIDGLSPNKAEENILKIDKRRANYYNYHASEKWGRAENYHLAVKSSYGGIDHAVACIKAYIEGSGE